LNTSLESFDLIVIGAGSGGVRSARMAAAQGKKVAVIENRYLGGTCVNVGCVPKKMFVYASEYREKMEEAKGFGINGQINDFHWPTLRDNKSNEITRLNGIYQNLLTGPGATIFNGTGSLVDKNTVRIQLSETDKDSNTTVDIRGEKILIATGSWPFIPEVPGAEHAITSNEVFSLADDKFPKRALVVGAGYIAVEFAGIFNGLGVETTLAVRKDLVLRGFDDDIRIFVQDQMKEKGVNIQPETEVKCIDKQIDGSLLITYTSGEQQEVDLVLYATGRRPMTDGLNLEGLGIELNSNGTIKVDDFFQTNVSSVFALGDVIGTPQLTPIALAQGMKFLSQQYHGDTVAMHYENIPTAVFCQPNIGTVGPTEDQCKEKGIEFDVYESNFKPLKHTMTGMSERTLMKLIVNKADNKVIAAHMVGHDAGETIQGIAIAIVAGATKADFDATIGIHPTSAEEFVTMRSPRS
jgi:glutathione reductase (NADPH)